MRRRLSAKSIGPSPYFELSLTAIERLFGLLDLGLGRLVVRRLIGGVDDILADADQRAAHRQIVQDARIVAHIGHGRRGLRQAREIGVAADFDQAGIGLHRRVQGQRRQHHAAALRSTRTSLRRCADAADRRNAPA